MRFVAPLTPVANQMLIALRPLQDVLMVYAINVPIREICVSMVAIAYLTVGDVVVQPPVHYIRTVKNGLAKIQMPISALITTPAILKSSVITHVAPVTNVVALLAEW